MKNSVVVKHL